MNATCHVARKYSVRKYISVFIITGGIVCRTISRMFILVFQMMSSKKKTGSSNSTFGLILLFLSLCCDGVCGMQQDIVVPRYKPSSLRLQQMLNIYGILVSFVTAVFQKELIPGLSFLFKNKLCLWVCCFILSDYALVCYPIWFVLFYWTNVYSVYSTTFPSISVINNYHYKKILQYPYFCIVHGQ